MSRRMPGPWTFAERLVSPIACIVFSPARVLDNCAETWEDFSPRATEQPSNGILRKRLCGRAATSLKSSTIVVGQSDRWTTEDLARQVGTAWENLGDPRPQFNLEVHMPNGDKLFKVLGPHAPNLTLNEVNLLHHLWLRFSDALASEELHHHDVVHFALNEVSREIEEGKEDEVAKRIREHILENKRKRTNPG